MIFHSSLSLSTWYQDVAKLRSVFRFDAFSKRNETKFETKWTISKFFQKISKNFDYFVIEIFRNKFRSISIVDEISVSISKWKTTEIDRNFDGIKTKLIEINFEKFRSKRNGPFRSISQHPALKLPVESQFGGILVCRSEPAVDRLELMPTLTQPILNNETV